MKSKCIISLFVFVFASCATPSPRQATLERMLETRLPEIRFRDAEISDVISFLVQASREAETERIGVGIVFMDPNPKQSTSSTGPVADPFGYGPLEESKSKTNPPNRPRITMSLRNVTLLEALEAVCDSVDLRWEIDKNGILLVERKL